VSAIGQADNIGDSALRREYLNALRGVTDVVHVFVADHTQDYIDGLGLKRTDRTYSSSRKWISTLIRMTFRGRSSFAFNAGETQPTKRRLVFWIASGVCIVAMRAGGGKGVHAGVGLRSPIPDASTKLMRFALSSSNIVTWRDHKSALAVGRGKVRPDWAFGAGTPSDDLLDDSAEGSRRYLTITMRFDRPLPNEGWIASIVEFASQQNLEMVLIAQVERDIDRCNELSVMLGGVPVVQWSSRNHAAVETETRHIYKQSAAVVSDRLHALVFAATEGAVPIGYSTGDPEKLERTLEAAGLSGVAFGQETTPVQNATEKMGSIMSRRVEIAANVISARVALKELEREITG